MKIGSAKSWARTLGSALAHVQHTIDGVAEWGFVMLKKVGREEETPPTTKKSYLRVAEKAGRTAVRFLGIIGDSYFRKYRELKKNE